MHNHVSRSRTPPPPRSYCIHDTFKSEITIRSLVIESALNLRKVLEIEEEEMTGEVGKQVGDAPITK